MPFLKNRVAHFRQRTTGDCLAACAAMALSYVGIHKSYSHVLRSLETVAYVGTPFSNIRNVSQFGVTIVCKRGTLTELRHCIANDQPCIVAVDTGELPYWQYATPHAVIVVGIDDILVHLHDPSFPSDVITVPIGDFDLAWLEGDELYATLMAA